MERLKKKLERVCVLGLLLSAVLTFSQCKKESPAPNDFPSVNDSHLSDSQSVVSNTTVVPLDLSNATVDEGFAFRISKNFGITGDSNSQPTISKLRIFEDGKELGAAHSTHASIRTTGKGKFSHWSNSLIFSTSDNSDPRKNGRKYTFTTGGTPGTVVPPTTPPTTPTTPPTGETGVAAQGLLGYAAENGITTGGKGGQTVTVSTLAALKSAAASSSPTIIQVSGTITGTGMINVSSNKSIIGLKGSKLNGVGLLLYTVNNVIIQNMTIANVVGGDAITIKESTHHVWVDHCDLSADKSHGWDYYDGLLDITNKSNYITVSWNKIHDSNIAMLIGAGYTNTDDKGTLKVTLYNNYFSNISERTPDAKFGSVHMFNNYFNQSAYVGAFMGATIRLENNYFKGSSLPVRTDLSSTPGVISGLSSNIFEASGANRITSSASTWEPTYTYKTAVIAAANVPSVVSAGAGATL
ncbi:pectate lyase [Pedobacter sp. PLR]|uniref:pectate lyase family protein n=1 Tax=Pedobacter sp. PLR TaxID=2994465 RepID=UPI00224714BB|nr:pectate lyase [Pedobacter sp. PLR]MCX2449922.1 pectate lyase [Pedobacter sp. PLR]